MHKPAAGPGERQCLVRHDLGLQACSCASSLDQVAAIMEPKRTKRLTDEQRARLVEAGQLYRFQAGAKDGFPERQAHETDTGDQEVA